VDISQLGREEPAMSMDVNGKIIWAKHAEIQQANIKALADQEIKDGERLALAVKDMGSCEIYPQTISHNPNGRCDRYLNVKIVHCCLYGFVQVCCGLWRWRIHHLHRHGSEEQELRLCAGVCVVA
jgi:hypothetical protein